MSVQVRQVINPSKEEVEAYCEVLADAFNYQFFAGALMNNKSLQLPMHHAHVDAALTGEGEVHIAELPDEGVVGVAVWFGPGQWWLSTEKQLNMGWNQLMEKLDQTTRDYWTEMLKAYNGLDKDILGPDVKRGSYHLQLIGVKRSCQKKGVGKALLMAGEEKARAAGVPTCLETMVKGDAAKYYVSVGYTMAGQGTIPWIAPGSSFEHGVFIKHTEKAE